MARKKDVQWNIDSFEDEEYTRSDIEELLAFHAERGNIKDGFEIKDQNEGLQVHFDVNENIVDHPSRFLFKLCTPYGGTAWHDY